MHGIHVWPVLMSVASAAPFYSLAAHMAQRIPVPDNKWIRWVVDGVQFYFANNEKRQDIAVQNAVDARVGRGS